MHVKKIQSHPIRGNYCAPLSGWNKYGPFLQRSGILFVVIGMVLSSCLPAPQVIYQSLTATPSPEVQISATPLPTRPVYGPGELVDYAVQDGDNLKALAARFNTTVDQIRKANPIIPDGTTTLPPGMPMKIPIYYLPLWGSSYQIIPDALFVDGPAEVGFDAVEFSNKMPGWLNKYRIYAYDGWRTGPELVAYIGLTYSVSPRLLLAILEYRLHALSDPDMPAGVDHEILGYHEPFNENLYLQLLWLADTLNDGFYSYLDGKLLSQDLSDGEFERFDPWQNAGTVTLMRYFDRVLQVDAYREAISPDGLAKTYANLFGAIQNQKSVFIPGSLQQPDLKFPFVKGKTWFLTGGPHPGWGEGFPFSALDFAPPANNSGCTVSTEWVAAVADGVLARTESGLAMLDLDGDGDERTGWVILYLHLSSVDAAPQGKILKAGDVVGHPSCERGHATGTHVHVVRKYNGEWIAADGVIPFNLEGWIAHSTGVAYEGSLTRAAKTITACSCGDAYTQALSEK
jgi:LasA protease